MLALAGGAFLCRGGFQRKQDAPERESLAAVGEGRKNRYRKVKIYTHIRV